MEEPREPVLIDPPQRLSESLIWEIQRTFFTRKGVGAWTERIVPAHISSNPYMARAYGRFTKSFLRDCLTAGAIDPSRPITIVELGGGAGRLAYHFLHYLLPQLNHPPFADLQIRYVLTDFTAEMVPFWQAHPRFQAWIANGQLDFALFDAVVPGPLPLIESGETIFTEPEPNPVVLIANYFFDSIPMDAFAVRDGCLYDYLLRLTSSRPEPDLGDPAIWERLEWEYGVETAVEPRYDDATMNGILTDYAAQLPDTLFLYPNAGMDCLRFWEERSAGPLLTLTADKGFAGAEGLLEPADPLPGLHGSFSFMVNYHALSEYVVRRGGMVLQPAHYQDNLHVLAYLSGQIPNQARETRATFQDAWGFGGPDDFYGVKTALEGSWALFTLPQLLNILRLSVYDAELFLEMGPALQAAVAESDPVWYADVAGVLRAVWAGYFGVGEETAVIALFRSLCQLMGVPLESVFADFP